MRGKGSMSLQISKRYQLQGELGSGTMGQVYRAIDRLTRQTVALKVVKPQGLDHEPSAFDSRSDLRLNLAQEFKLLASLRHPNIISVLDYGFTSVSEGRKASQPYFTMELLQQAQPLNELGLLSPPVALGFITQTLQALSYLHRRGIIHRDLKPANVVLESGQVKVLDFGLAIPRAAIDQASDEVAGTLAYMAPELFGSIPASELSDLYAVGVMAYELLVGKRPFDAAFFMALIDHIVEGAVDYQALPDLAGLRQFIQTLMHKDPRQRYPNAHSALMACAALLGGSIEVESSPIRESFLQAARFVGREAESAQLLAAFDKIVERRQGGAWLIGGESGIGKSRLVDEIRVQALVDGALVLQGQAVAEGGVPYQSWRTPLRHLCLETDLSDYEASVLKPLITDIAALLERPIPDAPAIDPIDARTRLFTVIETVLGRIQQPMVLLLEDIHWAQEGISLLKHLQEAILRLPLLILATYRNDEAPNLPQELSAFRHLKLERLPQATIAELSASMLGESVGVQPHFVDFIERETEGNVFFIVEVIRALADEAGELSNLGNKTLPARVIAQGMQALLERRLKRIPPTAYAQLELAAVLGREVDLPLLAHAAHIQDPKALEQWVQVCAEAAVLEVQQERWRFAHDKLRENLLANLPRQTLKQHHQSAALAIQALYPDDTSRYVQLAYHWGEAQDEAKEAHYAALAGEYMLNNASYQVAVQLLERALALGYAQGAGITRLCHLEHKLSEAYVGVGSLELAQQHAQQALQLIGFSLPDEGQQRRRLAYQAAWQALHRLGIHGRVSDDPDLIERYLVGTRACAIMMMLLYFRNRKFELIYYTLLGLNLAQSTGAAGKSELPRANATFSISLGVSNYPRLAVYYSRRADHAAKESANVNSNSWALLMTGIYAVCRADWADARQRLGQSITMSQRSGHIRRLHEGWVTLASVDYFTGQWADSEGLGVQICDLAERHRNRQALAWGMDDISRVMLRRGHYLEAEHYFLSSLEIYKSIADVVGEMWAYGALAQLYLQTGQLDQAQEFAQRAQTMIGDSVPTTYGVVEAYLGWLEVAFHQLEQTPNPSTQAKAQHALRGIQRYARIFNTGAALAPIYESRFLRLTDGPIASAIQAATRGVAMAQQYGLPYDEGLAQLELAQLVGGEHIGLARASLERLEAAWELTLLDRL
jgi:tetratricopeptide (TPR) repeat protein